MLARVNEGTAGFESPRDHLHQIKFLFPQGDLALSDARYVKQIVNEPGQVLYLPLNHPPRPFELLDRKVGAVENPHSVEDRSERVAKLVRQHRQKLVLAPVGLSERLLGQDASSDVNERADRPTHIPRFIAQGHGVAEEMTPLSVVKDDLVFVAPHLDAPGRRLHRQLMWQKLYSAT